MLTRLLSLAGLENRMIFSPCSGHEYRRMLAWQIGSTRAGSKRWSPQVNPPSALMAIWRTCSERS